MNLASAMSRITTGQIEELCVISEMWWQYRDEARGQGWCQKSLTRNLPLRVLLLKLLIHRSEWAEASAVEVIFVSNIQS